MKILLLDNYDSFTYNLYHYLSAFENVIDVKRNDEISIEAASSYEAFVISPGPGLPEEAGITLELIKKYYKHKKILGICLGHQAIAVSFGAQLKNLNNVLHGLQRDTYVCEPNQKLYNDIPASFPCGRYHSWVVDKEGFPHNEFLITATDTDGEIMSIAHKKYNVIGIQFHPESIMTPYGKKIIENWVAL